jgi:hypothetical protein
LVAAGLVADLTLSVFAGALAAAFFTRRLADLGDFTGLVEPVFLEAIVLEFVKFY